MSDPITAAAIQALFEKHWKRRQLPESEYYGIAIAIRVVRDRRPHLRPVQPNAVMHGRRFLGTVAAMRADLECEAGGIYSYVEIGTDGSEKLVIMDSDRFDRCRAALVALEEAESKMALALDAWEGRDRLHIEPMDPAKFICARVQRAWACLGNDVPRSVNEGDPLCEFVADALKRADIRVGQGKTKGQPYTAAAVSAVLSGQTKRLNFIRVRQGDDCPAASCPP
jgi:hypothetical protein